MGGWSRGDKIALASLLVAIVSAVAAIVVVPDVRYKLGLDGKSASVEDNLKLARLQQNQGVHQDSRSQVPEVSAKPAQSIAESNERRSNRSPRTQPGDHAAAEFIKQTKVIDTMEHPNIDILLVGSWKEVRQTDLFKTILFDRYNSDHTFTLTVEETKGNQLAPKFLKWSGTWKIVNKDLILDFTGFSINKEDTSAYIRKIDYIDNKKLKLIIHDLESHTYEKIFD